MLTGNIIAVMKSFGILAALVVALPGLAADVDRGVNNALITERHTNGFVPKPLAPGPDDSRIARAAAAVVERFHYAQQPLDDEVSAKFYDKYLDSLDPGHVLFLQSDLAAWEKWRKQLDDLTLKAGDTWPADIIFNRFLQRFTEHVEFCTNLIATEKFEFKGNERYTPNRKDLPRPKDIAEARQMWRDRVRFEWLDQVLNKEKPEEIKKTLTGRYTRTLRMLQEFDNDDVMQMYLTALTRVYDPHSDYMAKASAENFNIQMKLSLFGIGALLQSEDGYCKITELKEGPAKNSGQLKPNDKIVAVAQGTNEPVDVIDMKLNKVVEMIRGPKGSEVRLTVIPVDAADSSTRKIVSLIRAEIKLEDQEAKARLLEFSSVNGQPPLRVGIIDLPSFYADLASRSADRKSTTSDVAKLLKKLKEEKVAGVILDLRRNGGGSLEEAINLTGLFIKEGPVVQVKDHDGRITVDKDTDSGLLYDGPMVVMTSRFSASASEILAGALQDYGRALIVGDASTHGKGTVQTLLGLNQFVKTQNDLGTLKITIRKFYRASGSSTQLKGVVPDIILPSVNNYAEVGEASLPNALPWDTVKSASFEPVNVVPPALPELRKRSEARVAVDKDFAYVRDEIERFKKVKEEKTVSMNEEERWKEKKENEARVEARKKDLKARPLPDYKTYEITLKNAELPGLPPPTNLFAKVTGPHSGAMRAGLDKPVNGVPATNVVTTEPKAAKTSDSKKADNDTLTVVTNKAGTISGTNVVAKADEDKDDDIPAIDFSLEEGRKILQDLISLTAKNSTKGAPVTARK